MINGDNTNIITHVDNTDNIEIVADNTANASIGTESTNTDNINNAEIENEDNAALSNKNNQDATSGDDNTENVTPGETSTNNVPSPLVYGRKTTDPSKVKTSRKCRPVRVKPLESSMDDPPADKNATGKAKHHAFDPTDM